MDTARFSPAWLHAGAKSTDSKFNYGCKVYNGAAVRSSRIGRCSIIGDDTTLIRCEVGDYASLNRRNIINDSKIGNLTYTGVDVAIHTSEIGGCCSIAAMCEIGAKSHPLDTASLMPRQSYSFVRTGLRTAGNEGHGVSCRVGGDSWIGSHVVVLDGVSIGPGCVVGAGAIVNKDIPPFSIVVGIPARIIRFRFSESTIKRLLRIRWWDWEPAKIADAESLLSAKMDDYVIKALEEMAS